jgi:hypothetical protein
MVRALSLLLLSAPLAAWAFLPPARLPATPTRRATSGRCVPTHTTLDQYLRIDRTNLATRARRRLAMEIPVDLEGKLDPARCVCVRTRGVCGGGL